MSTTTSALRVTAVAAAAIAVAATAGCASSDAAPGVSSDAIRIGTHAPASGPAHTVATALRAYFEHLNAHGGVDGKKVELTIVDDHGTRAGALAAVRRLVEHDRVFAIVGADGASHRDAAAYLTEHHVPDLFVTGGDDAWNDPKRAPMRFGFDVGGAVQAKVLGAYAAKQFPDARACLLASDDAAGKAFGSGLDGDFDVNHRVGDQRLSDSDPTAAVTALQQARCTLAFVAAPTAQTAAAVEVAAAAGWRPTWISSSNGGDYTALAEILGPSARDTLAGLLSTSTVPLGAGNAWATEFAAIAKGEAPKLPSGHDTSEGMSIGYTFAETVADTRGGLTRDSLVASLESGTVHGAGLMPMTFSPTAHVGYSGAGVTQVNAGVQGYTGQAYLAAAGSSESIAYVGKGVPFAPDAVPAG